VKDQYVGDVNDYVKYALLRALAAAHGGHLHVCWMRTPQDGRTDGAQVAYLSNPASFRGFDPTVFDALGGLVSEGRRDVRSVEAAALLPGASYYAGVLPDLAPGRRTYFDELWSRAGRNDLVFFDPDNGMEVSSVPRGRRNSSKYLYWDELCSALDLGCSVCVYQHFPRRQRRPFVDAILAKTRDNAPGHRTFAIYTSRVAYLVATSPSRYERLLAAAVAVSVRPALGLTYVAHSGGD
jgi:hypothetical protein